MTDKIVMTTGDIEKTSSVAMAVGLVMLAIAYVPYYIFNSISFWQIVVALLGILCFYSGLTYEKNVRYNMEHKKKLEMHKL